MIPIGSKWRNSKGVYHDDQESNRLHDHRPPALRDGTGAGPDHAFDAAAGAIAQSNLRDRPWGFALPILAVAALIGVVTCARARRDELPFPLTVLFFLASYLTLGVMFWPYMVPYSITVADAAAPDVSLGFFFYGGVIVLPVIFLYSIGVYYLFRGKDRQGYG